ncbi:ATP-binding sensor histidine kinase [Algoriphagus sp.]|uniref:ATP-binding sensor histidine kinase n=1 Tax=Algoriphagus sp. TaxID=1872435 RepID=UPI0025D607EF|nr:ATP-binding sensor histidine kinase [Algoriphagus sp.]
MNIGEYLLKNKLYEDTETSVYEAVHHKTGNKVIIKVHSDDFPSPQKIERIKDEFNLGEKISGDGLAKYLELIRIGNGFAIVQEFFEGTSLDNYVKNNNHLSVEDFLKIAPRIAHALGEMHRQKIVHRDISSDNILVAKDFSNIRLIDFGVSASFLKISSERIGGGKIHYLSPEQTGRINRLTDYRTDFYSLGVLFYRLLSGVFPFDSEDSFQIIHKHIASPPPPLKEYLLNIPAVLEKIIFKLLSKSADDRYQSAKGLEKDLLKCAKYYDELGDIPEFKLAEYDFSTIFRMPRQLFGREKELKQLFNYWDTCLNRKETQFLLVSGSPGIGKSALIQELKKPVIEQNGFFLHGKYELLNQPIPYSGLIQAFESLLSQLMSEHKKALSFWRDRLINALGQNGKLLTDVFPTLEKIIGPQVGFEALTPMESQNRFEYVFAEFIKVFTSQPYPIALFLDDLQWIDLASLNLLSQLLKNNQNQTFFIVGAYRGNEVTEDHPLKSMLKDLKKSGFIVNQMELGLLPISEINNILAYSLMRKNSEVKEFSKQIHEKTNGNPFYVHRFIESLYERGLIYSDSKKGRWEWNKSEIAIESATENVVDFLMKQMEKLPENVRYYLGTGAAMGNLFKAAELAGLNGLKESALREELSPALNDSFLLFDGVNYFFVHDRIQQAAYLYLDDKEKVHLEIGEFFEKHLDRSKEDWVFRITNQLNRAKSLITDPKKQIELAKYNYEAGIKARDAVAFDESLKLLKLASELLQDKNPWVKEYDLIWNISFTQIEVEFISGDQNKALELANEVLNFASSNYEKALIYNQLIIFSTMKIQFQEALDFGRKGLELIGLTIPEESELEAAIGQGFGTIISLMEGKKPLDLLKNRTISPSEISSIKIKLIVNMLSPAFLGGQSNLWTYLVLASTANSIENGNVAESCTAFSSYGILCGLAFGDYQQGFDFGNLSYQLSKDQKSLRQRSNTCFVLGAFLNIYARPAKDAYGYLKEGLSSGLQSGELQFAGYNISGLGQVVTTAGNSLAVLDERMYHGLKIAEKTKNLFVKSTILTFYQLINDLGGPSHLTTFESEESIFSLLEKEQNYFGRFYFYLYKGFSSYLLGNPKGAYDYLVNAKNYLSAVPGSVVLADYYIYLPLIALDLIDFSNPDEELQNSIEESVVILEKWNSSIPENFQFRIDLISAIKKDKEGHILDALELYDSVITQTTKQEMLPLKAIAFEKAGIMMLNHGKTRIGEIYLKDSYLTYLEYGATKKVNQLQEIYPTLFQKGQKQKSITISETTRTIQSLEMFDSHTLIKASSAISQQVTLKGVLSKMMEVVLENAGAERGYFIMQTDDVWKIEAEGVINPRSYKVLQSIPYPSNSIQLPEEIINYVLNSQKSLLLEDAQNHPEFGLIPFLKSVEVKSILCLPVIHQGKLMAILYLENSLSMGAFTVSHKELLQTLSTQIAISISNAQLYDNLERKVILRTAELQLQKEDLELTLRDLKKAQRQLVNSEKMASMGELASGIAHEIQNPLNFVNNFTEVSDEMIDEILLEYSKSIEERDEKILNELLSDVKSNLQKIRKHGLQADAIVKNMLEHSKQGQGRHELTDLNALANGFLRISYHSFLAKYKNAISKDLEIEMDIQTDADLPKVNVIPQEIGKVLLNLLNNGFYAVLDRSIKNNETSDDFQPIVKVTTALIKDPVSGPQVKVSIIDNGIGIPEPIKEKIFQPFFTTKPTGFGTGLGLSLAYDIVQAHGGQLIMESKEGEGSVFTIILPISND